MAGTRTSNKPDTRQFDEDTRAMIFEGASISQLNVIFGMDNRTVTAKLSQAQLQPCGRRSGFPIYSIKEAAAVLIEPTLDLDDVEKLSAYVRKLNPANMPKMLTKEFWAAMRTKQLYEEDAGDLWRTEKVVEVFSELVSAVRTPLILAKDTVANERELDDRIQAILDRIIDSILEHLYDAVFEQFGARAAAVERLEDEGL